MSLSQCPRCAEDVTVPETVDAVLQLHPDAQMRCPRCGEQSPLRQISRAPMIEIVDLDGELLAAPSSVANAAEFSAELAGRPSLAGSANDSPSGANAIDADQTDIGMTDFTIQPAAVDDLESNDLIDDDEFQLRDPVGSSVSPSPAAIGDLKTGPPRSRKQTPMWKSLLSIAAGPPIAVVLGYFILAAAGKVPNLGFWPFTGSETTVSASRSAAAPLPRSTVADNVMPDNVTPDNNESDSIDDGPIELAMPGEEDQSSSNSESDTATPDDPEFPSDPATIADEDQLAAVEPAEEMEPTTLPEPPAQPSNNPAVEASIVEARQMVSSLDGLEGVALKNPTIASFRMLCDLAAEDPKRSESMSELLDVVKRSPHRSKFAALLPLMLEKVLSGSDGLFFIGEINDAGELQIANGPQMALNLPNDAPAESPSTTTGQTLMGFGRVNDTTDPTAINVSVFEPIGL